MSQKAKNIDTNLECEVFLCLLSLLALIIYVSQGVLVSNGQHVCFCWVSYVFALLLFFGGDAPSAPT